MITTAQAQAFGGPWGCCASPKQDGAAFTDLLLVMIFVGGAILCWWLGRMKR